MAETPPMHYRLWLYWLDQQWGVPNRSDFYLMQIAQVVASSNSVKKKPFAIKDFILEPEDSKTTKARKTAQETADQSISRWVGLLNQQGGPKVRIKGKDI